MENSLHGYSALPPARCPLAGALLPAAAVCRSTSVLRQATVSPAQGAACCRLARPLLPSHRASVTVTPCTPRHSSFTRLRFILPALAVSFHVLPSDRPQTASTARRPLGSPIHKNLQKCFALRDSLPPLCAPSALPCS